MSILVGDDHNVQRATLLVVDDEPTNLTVLTKMLQPYYRVRAVRSGE